MKLMKYERRKGKRAHWVVRGKLSDGTEINKSTGVLWTSGREPAAAKEAMARIIAEAKAKKGDEKKHGVYDATRMPMTLESLEKLFWERLETRPTKETTKKRYRDHWPVLHKFFSDAESFAYTVQLQRFVATRLSAGVKPPTIKKELDVLLGSYNLALRRGMRLPPVPARPDVGLKQHLPGVTKGHFVEVETVQEFYRRLCNRGVGNEAADRFLLCFLTGIRWGESQRLGEAKVQKPPFPVEGLERMALVLGKNNRWRSVPLGKKGWEAWQRSVPFRTRHNNTLFSAVRQEMDLPKNITLRDLRHTFATQLADLAIPQTIIDLVMGHDSSEMFMRYQAEHARRLGRVTAAIEALIIPDALC